MTFMLCYFDCGLLLALFFEDDGGGLDLEYMCEFLTYSIAWPFLIVAYFLRRH